jgi:hypothetical protein
MILYASNLVSKRFIRFLMLYFVSMITRWKEKIGCFCKAMLRQGMHHAFGSSTINCIHALCALFVTNTSIMYFFIVRKSAGLICSISVSELG